MQPLLSFLRGGTTRPNAAPLRITLARRLVETPGAPFVPTREVFTNVASARDEIRYMPPQMGPCVVRVEVEGGTERDRGTLRGDWLGDPDAGGRISRILPPHWTYHKDARKWASARPWLEAWETCEDGRWMLYAASRAKVDRRLLVLAACACARTVLPFAQTGENRPLRALEAAERWVYGEAPLEEVRETGEGALAARMSGYSLANSVAASAAYHASCVALDDPRIERAHHAVAAAAHATAHASALAAIDAAGWDSLAGYPARVRSLALCANFARDVIPTLTVLRAVATSA